MNARLLVMAKAPVPGHAKTRLGAEVGMQRAALLAAAALLDTVRTCTLAVGADRCRLALHGSLSEGVDAQRLAEAADGWVVLPQRGRGLAARLAASHADLADEGSGPVVQIGMDTPQISTELLRGVIAGLEGADAVLGQAEDGGWWVLGLADPRHAAVLDGVPMSTPSTGAATRRAFEHAGLEVGNAPVLRDVDTARDAAAVAAACSEGSEFARVWAESGRALA
jgi:glycosyltransferase A (GT-A) superfamily protein (DUF2064 family)